MGEVTEKAAENTDTSPWKGKGKSQWQETVAEGIFISLYLVHKFPDFWMPAWIHSSQWPDPRLPHRSDGNVHCVVSAGCDKTQLVRGAGRKEKTDCSRGRLQITGVKAKKAVRAIEAWHSQHSPKGGKLSNQFFINDGKRLNEGEPGRRKPLGRLTRELQ